MTYGDGVSNINIKELCEFHRSYGKLANADKCIKCFGVIDYDDKGQIAAFREKSDKDGSMTGHWLWAVMEPSAYQG